MMKNLDQIRAANAIKNASKVLGGANDGEVVKKVPTMIRENGFLAAAAFAAETKGNGTDYKNPGHKAVFECIIEHLSAPLIGKAKKEDLGAFITAVTEKDSAYLRDITAESMAYLNYLRRFARAKK